MNLRFFLTALLLLLLGTSGSRAFPPAPHYVLHGIVRDQAGQTVTAEGAAVILLKGGVEVDRTAINPAQGIDQNYELVVRIDQNRSSTTLYSEKAVPAQGLFGLVVEMGGSRHYPIEVKGNLTAGKGGERVRLDLTLGDDLDGDGLPDAWEQWQLFQAGLSPNGDGHWNTNLIDRNGDFDGDGQNNLTEYLAGTFAGDATERFEVTIKEKSADSVRFEFFAITGKTYTLERSTDLKTWTAVPFSAGAQVPASGTPLPAGEASFTATGVGVTPAACVPGGDLEKELYRLTVR
jgi:hypothetical protein